MSDAYVDVNARLVWSRSKLHRKRMFVFLVGTIAAVIIVLLEEHEIKRLLAGIAGFVFFCFCFYDIYKMLEPNSALIELLPQGIIFRTTSEDFIVPWNEIKGVDTIDIHAEWRGRMETYPGVTVILVSRVFYDRVIHVGSFIMRGPGWDAHFVEKDANTMMLALHHEILPVGAAEVRRQVEERWRCLGKQAPSNLHSSLIRTGDS